MSNPSSSARNHWRRAALQAALCIALLGALAWRARPDGRLHVVFPATKGDAALVETPDGRYILIGGGADPTALTTALGRQLPFWRRSLAAVVLPSTAPAQLPGQVAALARYQAELALAPRSAKNSALLDEWRRLLAERATPLRIAKSGDQLSLGRVTLRVLAGENDTELLLRLDYGATSVVFDRGSDASAETRILRAGMLGPATLVTFPWQRDPHIPFLEALHPQALVLTDGYEAQIPLQQTMAERQINGERLYHERLHGTIEWVSDGRRSWIQTERTP